uniref:Schlafen AlbA-2 domain-containing protein n=1 Tax=Branchiostoma floridae TaxID=7739 RepID=C3ZVT7_BRAFL|eukprot:XP_002587341.1 hypothetical protein BRAFLDRAFT_100539 [Branchiostoma floridae]
MFPCYGCKSLNYNILGMIELDRPAHYIHEEVIKVDRDVVFMTGYDAFCQDLKKNACAFLNGNGGTMFVGVLDNGTVKGVGLTSSQEDDLSRSAHDTIADFLPDVPPSWINVRFVPIMNLELKVVEVHVKAGPIQELYETGDHKVFMRKHGKAEELNPLQIAEEVVERYKMTIRQSAEC